MENDFITRIDSSIESVNNDINALEENKVKLQAILAHQKSISEIVKSNVFAEIDYLIGSISNSRKFSNVADHDIETKHFNALSMDKETLSNMINDIKNIKSDIASYIDDKYVGKYASSLSDLIANVENSINGYQERVNSILSGDVLEEQDEKKVVSQEPYVKEQAVEQAPSIDNRFYDIFNNVNENAASEKAVEPVLNDVDLNTVSLEEEADKEVAKEVDDDILGSFLASSDDNEKPLQVHELDSINQEIDAAKSPVLDDTQDLRNMASLLTGGNNVVQETHEDAIPFTADKVKSIDDGAAVKVTNVEPFKVQNENQGFSRTLAA